MLRTAQYDSASDHCMLSLVEYALHQKSAVDHARDTTFRRRPSVSQSLGRDFSWPLGRRELSQVLVGVFTLFHFPCIKDSCLLVAPPSSALPMHLPCHHSPSPP